MARKLIIFVCTFVFAFGALAQTPPPPPTGDASSTARGIGGPRKQLATILFAGLGGSILGLSTLSFYGRPQDHLANIAVGFAVGVITGTAYVTYKAANNPRELYGIDQIPELERIAQAGQRRAVRDVPLSATYSFSF